MSAESNLEILLRALKLPVFLDHYEDVGAKAAREGWTPAQFLGLTSSQDL